MKEFGLCYRVVLRVESYSRYCRVSREVGAVGFCAFAVPTHKLHSVAHEPMFML